MPARSLFTVPSVTPTTRRRCTRRCRNQALGELEDRQDVVLLLRLLIDRRHQIIHGDAGGPDDQDPNRERWIHFHGPSGLLGAVQAWLATAVDADRPRN